MTRLADRFAESWAWLRIVLLVAVVVVVLAMVVTSRGDGRSGDFDECVHDGIVAGEDPDFAESACR